MRSAYHNTLGTFATETSPPERRLGEDQPGNSHAFPGV